MFEYSVVPKLEPLVSLVSGLPVRFQHLRLVDISRECRDKSKSFWPEMNAKRTQCDTALGCTNLMLSTVFDLVLGGGRNSSSGDFRRRFGGPFEYACIAVASLEAWRARDFLSFRLLAVVGRAFRGGLKFAEIAEIPPKFYIVDMVLKRDRAAEPWLSSGPRDQALRSHHSQGAAAAYPNSGGCGGIRPGGAAGGVAGSREGETQPLSPYLPRVSSNLFLSRVLKRDRAAEPLLSSGPRDQALRPHHSRGAAAAYANSGGGGSIRPRGAAGSREGEEKRNPFPVGEKPQRNSIVTKSN
uniref:Uncharacterized protein n=1 Tax=Ananas comosus var. bracteatus TaxID=296719 RepID=A0A6V7QUK8_ANACO